MVYAFVSPGNAPGAITEMLFKDKSMRRIEAGSSDKPFAPTDVIELEASFKLINCWYLDKLSGTAVSWLELRSIVSMGVLAGVFAMIVVIFALSTFLLAPPTVNGAQVRVNVVVLLAVGPQVQGVISNAYSGHWQRSGVKYVDEMTVVSKHLAAVSPEPKRIKLCLFEDDHHLRLPQLVAVQSHDVVFERSM